MPDGTIKVDVSDMYDWYKLGQHISDLKSIDKSTLGKGPPSTVFAFGSEELENKYSHELTNLGLKTHDLDEPGEEDVDESQEITKLDKLDSVLEKCIEMIRRGHDSDPEKYGRVAACLIDNKNNHTYAINMPGPNHTRRHAERMAIDKHLESHGRIGPNAIMITTLSPCVDHMDERYGESCTDLLSDYGIEKCYAGWQDPTQHPAEDYPFNMQVTDNADIFNTCKDIAASFLPQAMAEDLSRRGFLKGAGAAAAGVSSGVSAQSGNRDTAVDAITKMAGTAWDMRRLGWSRSQAMNDFENKMGYKGELLRVAGLVCNFAWSVPKDHYTRNEFVSNVRQQALKNLPGDQSSAGSNNPNPKNQPTRQDNSAIESALIDLERKFKERFADYQEEKYIAIKKGDFYDDYQKIRDKENRLREFNTELWKAKENKFVFCSCVLCYFAV
jgi:pyrimidine deaminase RibD-like protein